jgi:DNA-binding transcriptional LysR family regulator
MQPFVTWTVGGRPHKLEPVLVVNDLEIACEAAIAGLGVAQLPSLVCRDAVADGRLRILFDAEAALVSPVHAVYPSRQYLPPKTRLFLDLLLATTIQLGAVSPRRQQR